GIGITGSGLELSFLPSGPLPAPPPHTAETVTGMKLVSRAQQPQIASKGGNVKPTMMMMMSAGAANNMQL
ncbi:unnamed protein product, partial [Amoebophrya sp. A25]